jgi:hypothetical protein
MIENVPRIHFKYSGQTMPKKDMPLFLKDVMNNVNLSLIHVLLIITLMGLLILDTIQMVKDIRWDLIML